MTMRMTGGGDSPSRRGQGEGARARTVDRGDSCQCHVKLNYLLTWCSRYSTSTLYCLASAIGRSSPAALKMSASDASNVDFEGNDDASTVLDGV